MVIKVRLNFHSFQIKTFQIEALFLLLTTHLLSTHLPSTNPSGRPPPQDMPAQLASPSCSLHLYRLVSCSPLTHSWPNTLFVCCIPLLVVKSVQYWTRPDRTRCGARHHLVSPPLGLTIFVAESNLQWRPEWEPTPTAKHCIIFSTKLYNLSLNIKANLSLGLKIAGMQHAWCTTWASISNSAL